MRKHTKLIVFTLVIIALVGALALSACTPKVTPTGIALNDSTFPAVAYGGQLDLSGKKVVVSYDNGTTTESDLTASMLSGFSSTTVGEQTVTVTLAVDEITFTTTFKVTVLPANMTGISVTTQPKTSYFEGEAFDATGMVVTASFEDGTTSVVTDYTVDKTSALTTADTVVTVSYGSFNTTVDITVTPVVITEIRVKSEPSNVNYYVGQTFDATGLEVEALHNNGTVSDIVDFVVDTTTPLTVEDKSVTITYGRFTTSVDITVVVAKVTGIKVNGGAFEDVVHHQELNLTNRTITVTYEDNSTKDVSLTADMLSGFNKDTVGTYNVTVTYEEAGVTVKTTFEVKVVKYATGIEVVTAPSDTEYYAGQTFNKAGLTVQLVYSDETVEAITDFVVDTTTPLTIANTSVTITYGDFSVDQAITVLPDEVDTIAVVGEANLGDVYLKNITDTYDLNGMQITANYLSGKTENVDVTLEMCSEIVEFGQQDVTVTYEGKTATFSINAIENVVVGFEIVGEPRLNYYDGQIFDASGITYMITYTNGEEDMTEDVTLALADADGNVVAIDQELAIGTYTLKATYTEELVVTLSVEVVADNLVGIEITTEPKTEYLEGETFDPTGMVVTATYDSGKKVDVTNETTNDANGPMTSNTTIEFTYQDKTTSLNVIVLRDTESAAIFEVVGLNSTRELNLVVSEDTDKLYEFSSLRGEMFKNEYVDSGAFADMTDKLIGVGPLVISKDYFLNFEITGESNARVLSATLASTAPFIPTGAVSPKLVVEVNLDTQELISYTVSYSIDAMGMLDVVITVTDETISSVVVKNLPDKTEYFEGESFDQSGLVLTVNLGSGDTFETTRFVVKDSILACDKEVVVVFNGVEVTVEGIIVKEIVVESIEITTTPSKVQYYDGDEFNAEGLVVRATFNNKDTRILEANEYTFDKTTLTTTDIEVNVMYAGDNSIYAPISITVNAVEVTSIVVTNNPTKVTYFEGEKFDATGMEVTAYYNNSTEKTLNADEYSIDKNEALAIADQAVTVTYTANTNLYDTVGITVIAVVVDSIEIASKPTKDVYFEGDTLITDGLSVKATLNNKETKTLEANEYTVDKVDSLTTADTTVTVIYTANEAIKTTFNITINAVEVTRIAVTEQPNKIKYFVDEVFNAEGMVVTAYYNNSTEKTLNAEDYSIDKTDPLTVNDTSVTITYGAFSTSVDITVVVAKVTGITVNGDATAEVKQGGEIDLSGRTVTLTYEDNKEKVVPLTADMLSDFDKDTVGTYNVTVTYEEADVRVTTPFTVNVVKYATGIAVKTQPSDIEYFVGQTFDATGLTLNLVYSDASVEEITGFVVDTTTPLELGDQSVTITYQEFTTAVAITVSVAKVTGITVNGGAFEDVVHHQDINLENRTITVTYEDNSSKDVTLTADMLSGFDRDTVDTYEVTVTYTEDGVTVKTTFEVKVVKYATGIEVVTAPSDTEYYAGQTFNKEGLTVQLVYSDATVSAITDFVVDTTTPLTVANTSVTISYQGFTTIVPITVEAVEVTSIAVTKQPNKVDYVEGQTFDATGMEVTAYNNDGTNVTLTESDYSIDKEGALAITDNAVTVKYNANNAFTDEVSINVVAKAATGIEVRTQPSDTEYFVGQKFDATGLTLDLVFNDESRQVVESGFTVAPDRLLNGDDQSVTITYQGFSTSVAITVSVAKVTSISVEGTFEDVKQGEEIDLSDRKATLTYEDERSETIQLTANMLSGFDKNTLGTHEVTVTYTEANVTVTTQFTVNVVKYATGIEVKNQPNNTEYFVGETFDATGLTLNLVYSDLSKEEIASDFDFTPKGALTASDISVTISYQGFSTSVAITVKEIVVESIAVTTTPSKVEYFDGDEFNAEGLVVTATLNNKDTRKLEVSEYEFDKTTLTTTDTEVKVMYVGDTSIYAPISIKVNAVEVVSIAVTKDPTKVTYFVDEVFDAEGMEVTAYYNNSTEKTLNAEDYSIDKTTLSAGDQEVTVMYKANTNISDTVQISVIEKVVTGIEVQQPTLPFVYYDGQTFNTDEEVDVYAVYNDGTKEKLTADKYTVDNTPLKVGQTEVEVTYNDDPTIKANITNIKVYAITLQSFKLEGDYRKVYSVGEKFDPTGLTVIGKYSDGSEKVLETSEYKLPTGTVSETTEKLAISSGDYTVTKYIYITVVTGEIKGIEITENPTKVEYVQGESFDASGMVVSVLYGEGEKIEIPASDYSIDKTTLSADDQVVTVTYGKYTTTVNITVSATQNEVVPDTEV